MNIIHFEKLDSTNTYAKKNIDILADKTIVSTNQQTAGRGRFNRTWVDLGEDNIFLSVVLKPSEKFSDVYLNITQYLSLIICQELEAMGLTPQIKWPNDVLINGKKVAGILAEMSIKGNSFKGIVLGLGINVNVSDENLTKIDRPATALNIELGKNIDKQIFIESLINRFFEGYDEFLEKGFVSIKSEYTQRASFLNQKLKMGVFDKIYKGILKDIDRNGSLVLELENGSFQSLSMGEIII